MPLTDRLAKILERLSAGSALDGVLLTSDTRPVQRSFLLAMAVSLGLLLALILAFAPLPLGPDGSLLIVSPTLLFLLQSGLFLITAALLFGSPLGAYFTPSRWASAQLAQSAEARYATLIASQGLKPSPARLLLVWREQRDEILLFASPAALNSMPPPVWDELVLSLDLAWRHQPPEVALQHFLQQLLPLAELYFPYDPKVERSGFWAFLPMQEAASES